MQWSGGYRYHSCASGAQGMPSLDGWGGGMEWGGRGAGHTVCIHLAYLAGRDGGGTLYTPAYLTRRVCVGTPPCVYTPPCGIFLVCCGISPLENAAVRREYNNKQYILTYRAIYCKRLTIPACTHIYNETTRETTARPSLCGENSSILTFRISQTDISQF